ncbi:isopeptide-forming domain-containing fimbrial protein [Mediannikoviicoccus vaginalis]|uniref:isopeptide-forming domain-containing fimbrial protein n=1 Tax=Mediannikoviicoccus vaginalis TaxID=2899727 RepID=UPI001F1FFAD9|nr:pilin N-terminal domain-containing protein [Mediannikoviicoccus vaginalis]
MQKTKKLLSMLLAFVMVLGVAAPVFAAVDEKKDEQGTKKVYVHKMLMTKAQLDAHNVNKEGYDGNQIENLGTFFGEGATEIPGVYFVVEKEFTVPDTSEGAEEGATKKVWKAVTTTGTEAKADLSDALAGLTKEITVGQKTFTALELDTSKLPKGTYRINEVHEKSEYVGKDGKTLTDMKAVPTTITLPLVNKEGVVEEAHVYPKNTEEKPDTNKDFTREFENGKNGRTDQEKSDAKAEPHNVGDVIDYTVTTKVPAKTKWKTAFWDDKMTEGLTFVKREDVKGKAEGDKLYNKGLTVKYDGKEMNKEWYELDETENGFKLKLTDTGLKEIAKATEEKTIRIDYHATLNEKAVVAIPESNDVTFHYGNNEDHGNTPVPNKPNDNGELTITKDWDTGVAKQNVEFTLYNAQTGKKVEAKDVETVDGYEFENPVTITAGETMTYTWKGLNKNIEYKVVETYIDGHSVEYGKTTEAGGLTAKNYKDNNPKPINPNEPKVVTYGAKFVKTDTEGKRLPGAEFVVKKTITTDDGEKEVFLTGKAADRTEYNKAQSAFEQAIKDYNALEADKQTEAERAKIQKLEKARDDAWNATLKDMTTWADSKDAEDVLKLTSNELGQFEIAGLAPGTYTLVEVKAPDTYVDATKAKLEFTFTIGDDGEQTPKEIDFGINDDQAEDNAMRIINKKVDIPQTGGIGTIIFAAVGIALMVSAVVAMKKREAEEI